VSLEYLIKTLMTMLPAASLGQFKKIISVEGGVELLMKIISSVSDPSEVSIERIEAEKKKLKHSSGYGWRY